MLSQESLLPSYALILDSYQEKVRGFYFDFESMAPGEILFDPERMLSSC